MLDSFGDVLGDFIAYLKRPYRIESNLGFSPQNLMIVTTFFIVVFMCSMFLFVPLASLAGMNDSDHALTDLLANQSKWMVALMAIVAAPVAEEMIFRYPLKYRRPAALLAIGFVIMVAYMLLSQVYTEPWLQSLMLGIFGSAVILIFMVFFTVESLERLETLVTNNFGKIFYMTAVLFAIIHFYNFQGDSAKLYLLPILVFPQMVLGLVLGYLRMRFGMWSNLYVHALNNAIPMSIVLFFPELTGM